MEEDEKKPGFIEKMMLQAQKGALATMPKCELCGGHLAGGALTINHKDKQIVCCVKCIFKGMDFYLTKREEGLKE